MHSRDVFLCHASVDKSTFVRPLAKELAQLGVSCWVDEAQILPGESIIDAIQEGLTESRYVVVFITPSFLRRKWPKKELNAALSKEIRRGKTIVLPVVAISANNFTKQFPLLADKLYFNYNDGVYKIANKIAKLFSRVPSSEWYFMHPTKYCGDVWTRIIPSEKNRKIKHKIVLRWREFIKVLDKTPNSTFSLTHHKLVADRMPLYVSVNPPAIVTFGQGVPPDDEILNIDEGWVRISGDNFPRNI